MSTVEDTEVVDFISLDRANSRVLLTVSDHLPWADEQQHLELLDAKLSAYLSFAQSEQMLQELSRRFGGVRPKEVRVEIVAKYGLTPRACEFLAGAQAVFAEAGLELGHRVLAVVA
jgi:hypothetical protein